MTLERCKELIKERIKKVRQEQISSNNYGYYVGKERGLLEALELIGMIEKQNK
jgi:hypothetical protein